MTELHRTLARSTQDGRWHDLLSGVRGACDHLDAVLARYVPGQAGEGGASPAFVDALLGLVALRERLAAVWAAQESAPAPSRPPSAPPESLLR